MRNALILTAILTTAALSLTAAIAQPPEGPPPPPDRHPRGDLMEELKDMDEQDVRSLIETVRIVRLSQELGLTDEQTVLLVRQFNETKERVAEIQKERQRIAQELRELVESGGPEDEIEAKLDQVVAHDKEAVMARFDAFERISEGLSAVQKAKLYVFIGDFEKRMRSMVERARRLFREERFGEGGGFGRGGYGRGRGGFGRGGREGYEGRGGFGRGGRGRRGEEQEPPPEE
jgi:Spy/CpxP family protein refolding chaperone